MFVYRLATQQNGHKLLEVGYYNPRNEWVCIAAFQPNDRTAARALVNYLNGGSGGAQP